jgi:hypothetical protein
MTRTLTIFIVLALLTGACKPRQKKDPAPTILEGKKVDVSDIYKKRGGDLVEALYNELVQQSDELKALEDQIRDLQKNWPDSIDSFKKFSDKSNAYYEAAGRKTAFITDSLLRRRMIALIHTSQRNYSDSIIHFTMLDSLLKKRAASLNDLHQVLKLTKTLPLIEEFQKKHKPDTAAAQHATRDLDALIQKLDSLMQPKKDSARK